MALRVRRVTATKDSKIQLVGMQTDGTEQTVFSKYAI